MSIIYVLIILDHDLFTSKIPANLVIISQNARYSNQFLLYPNQDQNSYLGDCLYALAYYIISKIQLIKSGRKKVDNLDLNKGVLSKE